jgi:1,2-diacylglycerol 3-beta-glucosyltransferase
VKSLTEDLDIGIRLIMKNWENRYVDSTSVSQEGVENLYNLIHQRTRWSWGTLQAIRHHVLSLRVWKAGISLKKKADISVYLFTIIVPLLVLVCWVWSGLSFLGIIRVSNIFPLAFTMVNGFSFIPFYLYGLWKERSEYPLWQMIPLSLIATFYTYHWIPCTTSAIIKLIAHKPVWRKTHHNGSTGLNN